MEYEGSVETGFVFKLLVDRAITGFTIENRAPGLAFQSLEFAAALYPSNIVEISTVSGAKYATLNHLGSDIPILYGVSPSSAWINLTPGQNFFRVSAEGVPIPYTIEYTAKYGGI